MVWTAQLEDGAPCAPGCPGEMTCRLELRAALLRPTTGVLGGSGASRDGKRPQWTPESRTGAGAALVATGAREEGAGRAGGVGLGKARCPQGARASARPDRAPPAVGSCLPGAASTSYHLAQSPAGAWVQKRDTWERRQMDSCPLAAASGAQGQPCCSLEWRGAGQEALAEEVGYVVVKARHVAEAPVTQVPGPPFLLTSWTLQWAGSPWPAAMASRWLPLTARLWPVATCSLPSSW